MTKRMATWTWLAAISWSLLLILFLRACDRLEIIETRYPDFDAAAEAGAINGGTAPSFLPRSATDIRHRHHIDTMEIWLSFRFAPRDVGSFLTSCVLTDMNDVTYPRSPLAEWWPEVFTEKSSRPDFSRGAFEFYCCNNGGRLAINAAESHGYYWYDPHRVCPAELE
jgi:hypothetical protein